jgi:hypothetical protein
MSSKREPAPFDLAYNGWYPTLISRATRPLAAFGNSSIRDYFSARIGCQIYGVYGMDLAALCQRPARLTA